MAARFYWVMEREAYAERRAIMEVEGMDPINASRVASDYAYNTRLGKAATAAANGNWEPAREWCAEIAARYGQDTADELIREIDQISQASLALKR
jgi:hypothetical protein